MKTNISHGQQSTIIYQHWLISCGKVTSLIQSANIRGVCGRYEEVINAQLLRGSEATLGKYINEKIKIRKNGKPR